MTAVTARFSNRGPLMILVGRALSVLTLTPYDCWKSRPCRASCFDGQPRPPGARRCGDPDRCRISSLGAAQKARRPTLPQSVGDGLLGAPINFIVLQRLPLDYEWRETVHRAAASCCWIITLLSAFGLSCVLIRHPSGLRGLSSRYDHCIVDRNWLFYVQRQFAEAHWENDRIGFHLAPLAGSSYFKLPPIAAMVFRKHRVAPRAPFVQPRSHLPASGLSRRRSGTA